MGPLGAKVAVLGFGTMGQCILTGLVAAGVYTLGDFVCSARTEEARDRLSAQFPGLDVVLDSWEAVSRASIVLLCFKPHVVREFLSKTRPAFDGKTVISVAAGITLGQLQLLVGPCALCMRAMPNTPSRIRQGMTVLSFDSALYGESAAKSLGRTIFEAIGRVAFVDDKLMDVVTALSGSGPAFACVMMEALADGAVMMGLPRALATELAAQMLQGTARLVLETDTHPAAIKDAVCTPAGCTIAGLLVMEDGKVRSVLARAIEEAARVASTRGQAPIEK